jgi:hypothetical protein
VRADISEARGPRAPDDCSPIPDESSPILDSEVILESCLPGRQMMIYLRIGSGNARSGSAPPRKAHDRNPSNAFTALRVPLPLSG